MLFDMGIVAAIYSGVRLYEKYKKRKAEMSKAVVENEKSAKKKEVEKEVEPVSEERVIGKVTKLRLRASVAFLLLSVLRPFFPLIYPFQMATVMYITFPIFRRAEKALIEERKLRAPVLTSAFLLSCMAVGQYVALGVGVIFHFSGNRIVSKTRHELKAKLTGIFDELPDRVWISKGGVEIEVALDEVCLDDIVAVNTGTIIPVDGTITEGAAMIDQHTLTGEFQPAEKTIGDQVFAFTVVMNGRIMIKVEKTGEQTTASKINDLLNNAADFKNNLQLKGEKWGDQSVLPILGVSALSLPIVHLLGMAAILNCGFESRILMLAPLGTLNHLHLASEKKIFVKDGRALEKANQIDTVLFDKTGTLTGELPEIGQIIPCKGFDEETILSYAATAESKMAHPIAVAITEKAKESNIDFSEPDDSQYTIGYGITVKIAGRRVRVGSVRFMKAEGVAIPEQMERVIDGFHEKGHSSVMVAVDDYLGGVIELRPFLRPEVSNILSGLRARGVKHLSIVSGDQEKPVAKLANTLNMDSCFAEILPENKAAIVERLQKEGKRVCFIGDGINDTIAMKKADLSISMSGATSIATDVAQVVLMDGSLSCLCDLFDISNGLKTNSKTTLGLMLAGTAINVGGVFFFHFGVMTTIMVNVAALVAGGANAMLPLKRAELATQRKLNENE